MKGHLRSTKKRDELSVDSRKYNLKWPMRSRIGAAARISDNRKKWLILSLKTRILWIIYPKASAELGFYFLFSKRAKYLRKMKEEIYLKRFLRFFETKIDFKRIKLLSLRIVLNMTHQFINFFIFSISIIVYNLTVLHNKKPVTNSFASA